MHRSGTSAIANSLYRVGLSLPDETDLITPGPFNERGYWESRRFVTFDDWVLRHLGGTWSAPPNPKPGWEQSRDPETTRLRRGAEEFSKREFVHPHMVLKDPRLCITLPLWRTVLGSPVAVLVLRDPLEVALSLERRNSFPLMLSLAIWHRYVRQSVVAVEGLCVLAVEYRAVLRDPRKWIEELVALLRDCGIPVAADRVDQAVAVLEPELRHHRRDNLEPRGAEKSSLLSSQRRVFETLTEYLGPHASWSAPPLGPEPPWVDDVIRLVAAGEAVTAAHQSAQEELRWIKKSRLFAPTRGFWRLTGRGPVLSPLAEDSAQPHGTIGAREAGEASGAMQIAHADNPRNPTTLAEFKLFAVIKSWMDEDVIEATVRNATAQGADAVYLVDNASSDATVRNASDAGAIVAEIYDTDVFDGKLVQALVNAVVARESLHSGAEHIWWLYLDSDEFPEGPGGMSLREYLATLDLRFRIVGSTYLNHVPSGKPEYLPGFHPIDFQPLYYTFSPARNPPCALGHWKHPLQRFDRHGQFVLSNDGAHMAFSSDRLVEPTGGIFTHHFQYRDEELTRAKLELVSGPNATRAALHESAGFKGFLRRRHSIDAVYSKRWKEIDTAPNASAAGSHDPKPWPNLAQVRRWYTRDELDAARRQVTAAGGVARTP
jgi:Glycosyl transferase family 2